MTPERQNQVIAELCGWTSFGFCGGKVAAYPPGKRMWELVPRYTTDLNACHEMEAKLDFRVRFQYQHELDKLTATEKDPHCSCWDFIHATAAQRAEAFLRTMGRWEETKYV
jgi:hypothetical protein